MKCPQNNCTGRLYVAASLAPVEYKTTDGQGKAPALLQQCEECKRVYTVLPPYGEEDVQRRYVNS